MSSNRIGKVQLILPSDFVEDPVHADARDRFFEGVVRTCDPAIKDLLASVYPPFERACRVRTSQMLPMNRSTFRVVEVASAARENPDQSALEHLESSLQSEVLREAMATGRLRLGEAAEESALVLLWHAWHEWSSKHLLAYDWALARVLLHLYDQWKLGPGSDYEDTPEERPNLRKMPWEEAGPESFEFRVPAYNPSSESWEEARERISKSFAAQLTEHKAKTEDAYRELGYESTPIKHVPEEHFDWLALRHVGGLGWADLASRANLGIYAVQKAVRRTAKLVGMTLRRDPPGPRRRR